MENRKRPGGRKKVLDPKRVRINFRITVNENSILEEEFKSYVGTLPESQQNLSDYLRMKLLKPDSGLIHINPIIIFQKIDAIGAIINKVGSNINQIARTFNVMSKSGQYEKEELHNFNENMKIYLESRKELINVFKSLLTNISK